MKPPNSLSTSLGSNRFNHNSKLEMYIIFSLGNLQTANLGTTQTTNSEFRKDPRSSDKEEKRWKKKKKKRLGLFLCPRAVTAEDKATDLILRQRACTI